MDWFYFALTLLILRGVIPLPSSIAENSTETTSLNDNDTSTSHAQGNETEEDPYCDFISITANTTDWEEISQIKDCHYFSRTHPRQELVSREEIRPDQETSEKFHFLAIFNIRYDLDFQEAGDRCSVRLHQEWLLGDDGPVDLDEYSYNRIWYERMCNPFSFLECVPWEELRTKKRGGIEVLGSAKKGKVKTNPHLNHTHPGALPDKHRHLPPEGNVTKEKIILQKQSLRKDLIPPPKKPRDPDNTQIEYKDSGRKTSNMHRMYIGGRGPGKGRHKSGPGAQRVDPSKLFGIPQAIPVPGYPLDGICACSAFDPKYPDRKRPKYHMDFVEDELRPDWCVSSPGGLCGRVYFPKNIWPGQDFFISDHIGCPKKYLGEEYECVRWSLLSNKDGDNGNWKKPYTNTATCEKKQEQEAISTGEIKVKLISPFTFLLTFTFGYLC